MCVCPTLEDESEEGPVTGEEALAALAEYADKKATLEGLLGEVGAASWRAGGAGAMVTH